MVQSATHLENDSPRVVRELLAKVDIVAIYGASWASPTGPRRARTEKTKTKIMMGGERGSPMVPYEPLIQAHGGRKKRFVKFL